MPCSSCQTNPRCQTVRDSALDTHYIYIGLGSNLGNGPRNLDVARGLLCERVGEELACSDYVEGAPWGFHSDHGFTNAVAAYRTVLNPLELLDVTQEIERQMGRRHKHKSGEPYTDRIIDLDLLEYDDLTYQDERLTLPHPLIEARDFVRDPLIECKKKIIE